MSKDEMEYIEKNVPVTENKDFFQSEIQFKDGSHEILLKFDRIYKDRMRKLLNFIIKVGKQQIAYGIHSNNIKEYEDTKYSFWELLF